MDRCLLHYENMSTTYGTTILPLATSTEIYDSILQHKVCLETIIAFPIVTMPSVHLFRLLVLLPSLAHVTRLFAEWRHPHGQTA